MPGLLHGTIFFGLADMKASDPGVRDGIARANASVAHTLLASSRLESRCLESTSLNTRWTPVNPMRLTTKCARVFQPKTLRFILTTPMLETGATGY